MERREVNSRWAAGEDERGREARERMCMGEWDISLNGFGLEGRLYDGV